MEPQENKKITLQKAINAHELAEAALADLAADSTYGEMVERIQANLADLRSEAHRTDPAEQVS